MEQYIFYQFHIVTLPLFFDLPKDDFQPFERIPKSMRILYFVLFNRRKDDLPVIKLSSNDDLSCFGFFYRNTIREHFLFITRTICQRSSYGSITAITEKKDSNDYLIYSYIREDGLSSLVVCDTEIPNNYAISFMKAKMKEFEKLYSRWSSYTEDQSLPLQGSLEYVDKIQQVEEKLGQIKEIMHKNIDEVLKRGETLDSLMEKSKDLSESSVKFYRAAKRQNQCCKAY